MRLVGIQFANLCMAEGKLVPSFLQGGAWKEAIYSTLVQDDPEQAVKKRGAHTRAQTRTDAKHAGI